MLKTNKFLYILPEMAFTASVTETAKEDYYYVQTFHQINGDFMKDENFLFENLKKLFERVDEANYTLVLPDFLFTDTIVSVPETEDVKIAEYLRDQLLPKIEVSTFSHETRTSVLLQRGSNSKVQLSALEKELTATIKLAIGGKNITIEEIVPLSWTLKAAVSLEPSLTIAQLGERLYLAEHYIGINQAVNAPLSDLGIIAETAKTLKGSEPNLQTAYLFTSVLVEEKLKDVLAKTLPVQQLTEPSEPEAKVPSYVKQAIEVAARTLSLSEFAVPRFTLTIEEVEKEALAEVISEAVVSEAAANPVEKVIAESVIAAAVIKETIEIDQEVKADALEPELVKSEIEAIAEETLEKTTNLVDEKIEISTEVTEIKTSETSKTDKWDDLIKEDLKNDYKPLQTETEKKADADAAVAEKVVRAESTANEVASALTAAIYLPKKEELTMPVMETVVANSAAVIATQAENTHLPAKNEELTLSFMGPSSSATSAVAVIDKVDEKNKANDDKISKKGKELVTKQKGTMGTFFKKLFLFILIFVITIVLGIGVGLGILTLTGKDVFKSETLPTPEPTFLPTPVPVPIAEPVATDSAEASSSTKSDDKKADTSTETDVSKTKVMIVNATGVAGLAGKTKSALEKDGFKNVQTGNAKGKYEEDGTFVLMKEKDSALIKILDKASGVSLIYDEDYQTEDPKGAYDVVIVLNQK